MRHGFTLVEMVVVISVLAALAGLSIPILASVRRQAAIDATATVVHAVATEVATYQLKAWTVSIPSAAGPPQERSYRMWDINGDHLVDGDPGLEDSQLPAANRYPPEVLASSYKGLVAMAKPVLPKRFHRPESGQVIDAWGQPLRIAYAERIYGSLGFGVWSAGPDLTDDPPTAHHDDIRSWDVAND